MRPKVELGVRILVPTGRLRDARESGVKEKRPVFRFQVG